MPLKLRNELPFIRDQFRPNKPAISLYAKKLEHQGGYQNFEVRLATDCLSTFVSADKICAWYKQYHASNSQINAAARQVLREMRII